MNARHESADNRTAVERKSDLELEIRRTFNGPARLVFQAWTTPELLKRWWTPRSTGMTLLSCQNDVRSGGGYRFEIGRTDGEPLVFFGKYIEVIPNARLVWTNEEGQDGSVTTVTFEEKAGKTLVVMHERYASKAALDETMSGMEGGMMETFVQLDELLVALGAN